MSRCSILVHKHCSANGCGTKHTGIQGGDCHPSYVFCKETQECNPLLYSSCGYSDWVKSFLLKDCIQHSPIRYVQNCVEKYLENSFKPES